MSEAYDRFDADYHARVKKLTGEDWCPYPSNDFMLLVLAVPDNEAAQLIRERRGYLFPEFLFGEPQEMHMRGLAAKYEKELYETWARYSVAADADEQRPAGREEEA